MEKNQPQYMLYINTPWLDMINNNGLHVYYKKIQIAKDQPLFFIGKCSICGSVFHSEDSCLIHQCQKYNEIRHDIASLYLIKWISIKMLSINSIESPFFKFFCKLLDPSFEIPGQRELRELIINYSEYLMDFTLKNSKSNFYSIMIDGTSRYRHHFISLILFSRQDYIYFNTKIVISENAINISDILRDCIQKLASYGKTVCSICSDNATENKSGCKIHNLGINIYRQYCNCHCASLAISHLFGIKGKYHFLNVQVKLALKILKPLKPPDFSEIKWKSLAECAKFIKDKNDQLVAIIDGSRKYQNTACLQLKDVNWEELMMATQIITSYIITLESDEMRIEFVFSELMKAASLLFQLGSQLSNDLATELIKVYVENDNLRVPLAAYLLSYEGTIFWQNCNEKDQEFYFNKGWDGICHFCNHSNIAITENMKTIFTTHLSTQFAQNFDPFNYWMSQNNDLTDAACKILSIPCSEAPVERLFGGLSFMYDPASNRMKDELIDAELKIRMSTIFHNSDDFNGTFLERLKLCTEFYSKFVFPHDGNSLNNKC